MTYRLALANCPWANEFISYILPSGAIYPKSMPPVSPPTYALDVAILADTTLVEPPAAVMVTTPEGILSMAYYTPPLQPNVISSTK